MAFSLQLNTDPSSNTISGSNFTFINSLYNISGDSLIYVCSNPTNSTNLAGFNVPSYTVSKIQNIPSGVTTISSGAFQNYFSLTSITFNSDSNLTSISNNAFKNCIDLSSITIPNSVTTIGDSAFANCYKLLSITIPNTGTAIDEDAFFNLDPSANVYTTYPLNSNNGVYNYFRQKNINVIALSVPEQPSSVPPPCFKEGSLVLTIDGYVPIQNLRKGDLVKTLTNGYLPINIIGKKTIKTTKEAKLMSECLFQCTNENYPEIFEDLYITGLHSILVDSLTKEQGEKIMGLYNLTDGFYITENKFRLPACFDDRATLYETDEDVTIYHLALDNENEDNNYGIYANGLLVETTSIQLLKDSDMTLIE